MKSKKFTLTALCLSVLLVSAPLITSSSAATKAVAKAGGVCQKAGSATTIAKVAYVCTKDAKTKKLTWVSKAGPAAYKILRSTPAGSISDKWVKWDSKACKFVDTNQHPATYVAELRAAPGLKIAYGSQSETIPQPRVASDSVKAAAKTASINLIVGDYNNPSTTDPLVQGQTMALQKPAGLISYMVLTSLIQPINDNFAKICAPVLQITVPDALNGPVFGLNNIDDGNLMGGILANWAKKKGWKGDKAYIVESFNASYGQGVTDRLDRCAATALGGAPGATVERFDVGTQTNDGQVAMTNWLTAHPNIHQILVCAQSDPYAIAMAQAFESAGRISDGAVVGTGGVQITAELLKLNSALVGTVDQAYSTYGNYVIPMIQDILAGKPVPFETHQKLTTITRAIP